MSGEYRLRLIQSKHVVQHFQWHDYSAPNTFGIMISVPIKLTFLVYAGNQAGG